MRNLSLINVIKDSVLCDLRISSCCCSRDGLYIVDSDAWIYVAKDTALSKLGRLPVPENAQIVCLDSSESTDQLISCCSSGELITVPLPRCENPEVLGCIDPGIAAAAWSPGEDQLAVVSSAYSLIFLGQDLDPLFECELQSSEGEKLVSVGWGKAETQFRGSAGKLKGEIIQESVKSHDDGKVKVSWRGDGQMVAISFFLNDIRHIKVVSNEGQLLYHSEPTPGLESSLCWKPSGALIASTIRLPNKHMVCFFEKNLLSNGGFELGNDTIVDELLWNADSSILAVVVNNKTCVKLYSANNYHWYHKYTITMEEKEKTVQVAWDKEDPYTFVIVSVLNNELRHARWNWRWNVSTSSGASHDDQAWAAVIDGKTLLLTAFRQGVVPPPMSSTTISASKPINSVGFVQYGAEGSETSSNDFFIHTIDGNLVVYRYDEKEKTHKASESVNCEGILSQISWTAHDTIIACANSSSHDLVTINLKTKSVQKTPLLEYFSAARRIPGDDKVLIYHSQNSKIVDLVGASTEDADFSGKVFDLEVRRGPVVFSLTNSHCLLAGQESLSSHVTSFKITDTHLLATTMQHKLLCWRLDRLNEPPSERAIERGARIVTQVYGSSSVVLQLPRGNLETIQPRALTITALQKLLNSMDYRKAFTIMRRERINLNLFYDHDPALFNVRRFVEDIADPTLLCNFIADLSEDNVISTQYSSFYSSDREKIPEKVDLVCSLLLCELEERKLLLPRLSCLVKKGDTESALLVIQSIKAEEKRREPVAVSSNDCLAHVLYIVDVEELFKVALGTYDLSLVMFIAGKSQKDPKEYVPFLANLQKMDESYQKFTIDNFLKRYKKALISLASCPNRVKECLDYVVKNDLYRDALRLFSAGTDTWKSVSVLYGNKLTSLGKHEEAGTVLLRAGEMVLAMHAFARAGAWRRELTCAQSMTIAEDQKDLIFKSIADKLRTARRYLELARFYLDHTGDVLGGIEALVQAHEFDEAIREAHLRNQLDAVEQIVKPGVVATAEELANSLRNTIEEIDRNLKRVLEIRQQSVNGTQDWDDTASESSRASSRLTTRSAKNARKLERNLMKKGGPFEVVALTAALHDAATKIVAMKSQVRSVNIWLISLDDQTEAEKLQAALSKALKTVDEMVKIVWHSPETTQSQPQTSNLAAAAFTGVQPQLPGPVQALQPKVLFAPDLQNGVDWKLDSLQKD